MTLKDLCKHFVPDKFIYHIYNSDEDYIDTYPEEYDSGIITNESEMNKFVEDNQEKDVEEWYSFDTIDDEIVLEVYINDT